MTNLERKYQLTEEFMKWFFSVKKNKITEPIWCKNRHCEDVNGDCFVCFTKWRDKEVKMTNLEKWKKKIAEAKDGSDFMYIIEQMNDELYEKCCLKMRENCCEFSKCNKCQAKLLDMEVEE